MFMSGIDEGKTVLTAAMETCSTEIFKIILEPVVELLSDREVRKVALIKNISVLGRLRCQILNVVGVAVTTVPTSGVFRNTHCSLISASDIGGRCHANVVSGDDDAKLRLKRCRGIPVCAI